MRAAVPRASRQLQRAGAVLRHAVWPGRRHGAHASLAARRHLGIPIRGCPAGRG
eukprot:SAG22_NODE_6241_length_881_cov_2.047315_2_plen_53_part_01